MDPRRFDAFSRFLAARASRRGALLRFGAGSLAGALAPSLRFSAAAQKGEPQSCVLQLHAETAIGPSENTIYDGELTIEIDPDGAIDEGTYTVTTFAYGVKGQVTGRTVHLRIELDDGRALSLTGVGQREIALCRRDVAGIFGGPEMRDLGTWTASRSRRPGEFDSSQRTATPAPTSTPATTGDGSAPTPTSPSGGGPTPTSPPTCPPPQIPCGAACCPGGSICDASTGSCVCPEGQTLCNSICTNLSSDPNNCGQCGNPCCPGCICVAGSCECYDNICNGVCTNLFADPNNCGECGHICPNDDCLFGACGCETVICDGTCCTLPTSGYSYEMYCIPGVGCRCDYLCTEVCGSSTEAGPYGIPCDQDPAFSICSACPP